MTDEQRTQEQEIISPKPTNTIVIYIVAIAFIFSLSIVACIVDPERSAVIITFAGSILVAFLAMLKGLVEVHTAVNSKMDMLLAKVAEAQRAAGNKEGREEQKEESKEPIEAKVIVTETIQAGKIEKAK